METKEKLREQCLKTLKAMSDVERLEEQSEVHVQVDQILNAKPKTISMYLSQPWELGTHQLFNTAISKGIHVSCPRVVAKNQLRHFLVECLSECELSKWGILEPKINTSKEVFPEQFDMIFVPGLAFCANGDRLGYGGGFYDRFLIQTKGDKIGLSFRKQLFLELPVENHDVQLDKVIAPKELVN